MPQFGDDLMNIVRRKNIFSNVNAPQTLNSSSLVSPEQPPDSGLSSVYSSIANSEAGPAQKKYRDFLDNQEPKEQDYQPGVMSRIGAILAGVGTGLKTDAGTGYATTKAILSEPYDSAMAHYKLQGDKLAKSADLEEKDINNRVKTYRDLTEDQTKREQLVRQNKLTDEQIKNYESQIENRGQGTFSQYNAPATGERLGTRINNKGQVFTVDLGKVDQTPDEKSKSAVDRAVGTARATSPIIRDREIAVGDHNRAGALDNEKAMADYRNTLEMDKESRANAERAARDASNPDRAFAARALAYRDLISLDPKNAKSIDLQTLTHKPDIDAKVKEAMKKYDPPAGKANTNTNEPKIGDKKTFPNGKMATWDGKGWLAN